MIALVDLLLLHSVTEEEIKKTVVLYHTEKQDKTKSIGKNITAYDLWKSDHDNLRSKNKFRDLNTQWEYYNRTHGKDALKKFNYLLSFVQIPITREPIFAGFYKILGSKPIKKGSIHPVQNTIMDDDIEENILEYDPRLNEFEGKLVLGGWINTPNIKRDLSKNRDNLFVKSILKETPENKFVYQSFLWSSDRISLLPSSWQNSLSQMFGVYLLVDTNGNQYVGSAYSNEGGFLSRWKQYEKNGHGGNKKLKTLRKDQRVFSVSILETAPSSYNPKQIIELESKWKEKLGTKAFGLNLN